jgi:hypothetical protein
LRVLNGSKIVDLLGLRQLVVWTADDAKIPFIEFDMFTGAITFHTFCCDAIHMTWSTRHLRWCRRGIRLQMLMIYHVKKTACLHKSSRTLHTTSDY